MNKKTELCLECDEMKESNDLQMERLLNELKEFKEEKQRLIDLATKMVEEYQGKINMYQEEISSKEQYTKDVLYSLVDFEKMKETKTQKSYQLVSGKITIPKDKFKMKLKSEYDENNIPNRFIEVKKVVKWGDYKKILKIVEGEVVNIQTGEIVDNVEIEKVEGGKLNLKLGD